VFPQHVTVAIQTHNTSVLSVLVAKKLMQEKFSYVSVEHTSTQARTLDAVRMTLSSLSQQEQLNSVALAVAA
jgi:hypothetical protein